MRVNPTRANVLVGMRVATKSGNKDVFQESLAVIEKGGMPVEMLQALSLRPELLAAFGALGNAVYPGGIVSRRIKEWIILFVSKRNNCQFCYESHCEMIRKHRYSDFPETMKLEELILDEQAAVKYALALTENVPPEVMEPIFAQLKTYFAETEIVEITFVSGFINCLNLFNNALGVRYNADYKGVKIA
jgi:AhpD family alkylhydroperoxidase